MVRALRRLRRGDRGASAVEYGLMVAGIAAVILVLVFTLGVSIRDRLFDQTCAALRAEVNTGADVEGCA